MKIKVEFYNFLGFSFIFNNFFAGLGRFLSEFDEDLNVVDMSCIHEAYQCLLAEYVENGGKGQTSTIFLTIEQIRWHS